MTNPALCPACQHPHAGCICVLHQFPHPFGGVEQPLFDAVGVTIKGGARRIMATRKTAADADAFVMMAVHRRGVDTEFFKMVPHGSEAHD